MRKILVVLTFISLLITGWLIFFWVPTESSQGIVQKIMYIKLPTILVAYLSFFISFVCSILYLWKREEKFDVIAACVTEIGVVFCGIVLIDGALWAKPTWNTYWTWDARLTTTLILFLVYAGYLLLRRFIDPGETQARLAAVVAIIGFLDVPLIHLSVKWWRTLHQPSTILSPKNNVIDPSFTIVLSTAAIAFLFLFATLLIARIDMEKSKRTFLKKAGNL